MLWVEHVEGNAEQIRARQRGHPDAMLKPMSISRVFVPLPEVERRLRTAFPELWLRYQSLAAARVRAATSVPIGTGLGVTARAPRTFATALETERLRRAVR